MAVDIYTRDRNFHKQDEIDAYESAIWTERYAGDGDFELSVEASSDNLLKLPKGQIMMCEGSDQPMILETRDIKDDILKTTGITLTKWLNNRTIRVFSTWKVKEWNLGARKPGQTISYLVQNTVVAGAPIFDGTWPIGIPVAEVQKWIVPGLVIGDIDMTGPDITPAIPFAQLYDTIKAIADSYNVGMKIVIDSVTADDYQISFNTYSGANRTSDQNVNEVIQFSKEMDSFTDIHDLESIADSKTHVYVFAPNADPAIILLPGMANNDNTAQGFDLRVVQEFAEDIDTSGLDSTGLQNILNQKAATEAGNLKAVSLVDGQIVPTNQIQYGVNYFLGDIVEVKGNTGVLQHARITEYIRSKDAAGEKSYPALAFID